MVLAGVALAGCGAEPRLGASDADELRRGVAGVRTAAAAGDRDGALRALKALRARVERAADGGALGEEDAAVLRRGIARARRQVEQEVAAPQPAPEPTVEPAPTAKAEPAPGPPEGKKPRPGKGNSQGRFGDEDDDEGDD